MRVYSILLILIMVLFSISGCGPDEVEMPADFGLSFSWNTGSLPPEHRYDYVITIGPGPQGEFDYVPGYGGVDNEKRWVTSFDVTQEDLRTLYTYFRDQGFFDTRWRKNDIEWIGGSTTSLILAAFGEEIRVPSISTLDGADLSKVKSAQTFIRGFVPQSVWDEMERRQEAFKADYLD